MTADDANAWRVKWADGSESSRVCFDARTAEQNPELDWVTLEDPRARTVINALPRCVAGQPLPVVRITGLPDTIQGVWSLWEISLSADGFGRKRFLPVFATDDGRAFVPTAKRIWDLLLTEQVEVGESSEVADATRWFESSHAAAIGQGERLFSDLMKEHRARLKKSVSAPSTATTRATKRLAGSGYRRFAPIA